MRQKIKQAQTRSEKLKYKQPLWRLSRLKNSPIPYLTRLLNTKWKLHNNYIKATKWIMIALRRETYTLHCFVCNLPLCCLSLYKINHRLLLLSLTRSFGTRPSIYALKGCNDELLKKKVPKAVIQGSDPYSETSCYKGLTLFLSYWPNIFLNICHD